MSVRVKVPLTEGVVRLQVDGDASAVAVFLAWTRNQAPGSVVESDDDDDELVDITTTDWFQKQNAAMTPGLALRLYRDNAGMTLRELAEKSGVAFSNLSAMERDKRPLGLNVARKVAKALGIPVKSLVSIEPKEATSPILAPKAKAAEKRQRPSNG
jgi:DNA-binding XRE family transcriptional regulator